MGFLWTRPVLRRGAARRAALADCFLSAAKARDIWMVSFSACGARETRRPMVRMSFEMSPRVRGLMARKATGCARISSTVSTAKGTEPMRMSGLWRMTSGMESFQQSPTVGRCETGATSLHQRETATRSRVAPRAQRMEVMLGAREMMRGRGTSAV